VFALGELLIADVKNKVHHLAPCLLCDGRAHPRSVAGNYDPHQVFQTPGRAAFAASAIEN
jgi:hypothetical protein